MGAARSADQTTLSEERQGRPSAHAADVYFLQQWRTLAEDALEDALYESKAMRELIGIDPSRRTCPMPRRH